MAVTWIVTITRATDLVKWLCDACIEDYLASGWTLIKRDRPPHELPCDDCAGEGWVP